MQRTRLAWRLMQKGSVKTFAALLTLAAVAGCSTTAPLPKAESPRLAAVHVPAALNFESIVIRAVHGQMQYWNGNSWAGLRPNLVLSNGVQIRPGADSCADLFGGPCASMRLTADHNQNVKAFLVHWGRRLQAAPTAGSSAGDALSSSAPAPCAPASAQIPAGEAPGSSGPAEVAIGTDGKVRVIAGELTLMGDGKTHLLRVGQCFDAITGEVHGGIRSKPALTSFMSRTAGRAEIVSAPRAVPFDGGLANARRGIFWFGE